MPLQLDSLAKSIAALAEALETEARFADTPDAALHNTLRAGVVQGFEVAYEQSWKMVQRWLRENLGPELEEQARTRRDSVPAGSPGRPDRQSRGLVRIRADAQPHRTHLRPGGGRFGVRGRPRLFGRRRGAASRPGSPQ